MNRRETITRPIQRSGFRSARFTDPYLIGQTHSRPPLPTKNPEKTCTTLFGPDDSFILIVNNHKLKVFLFTQIASERWDENWDPCVSVDVEPDITSLYPAGDIAPLLLYAIDVEGKCWQIDFRPRRGSVTFCGLSTNPLVVRIAQEVDNVIVALVLLGLNVVIQTRIRGSRHELWVVKPHTGLTLRLGTVELDGLLYAIDSARYNVLLGSCDSYPRFIVVGKQCRSGDSSESEHVPKSSP